MNTERKYAVIISPDGNVATEEFDIEILKDDMWFDAVKNKAGIGYAEVVYPFGELYPCLIDVDGKLRNLCKNEKATKLCAGVLFAHDYIVGSMVVTHFNGIDDLELLTQEEANKISKRIEERVKNYE